MKKEFDQMNQYETLHFEINYYVNLLRIKKAEQGINEELDYQIKVQENKLHELGVNTENYRPE